MKWTYSITLQRVLTVASLAALSTVHTGEGVELVEGIVGMDGSVYAIEDQPGGAGRSDGSPYESSTIALRDGRLLMVFGVKQSPQGRRALGMLHGMTSNDGGRSWSDPSPLKLHNGGPVKGRAGLSPTA